MAQPRLRVYCGPHPSQCSPAADTAQRRQTVTVSLHEVFPLLSEAFRAERTWLRDFQDEEIAISTDLYEVILAYQHYRRPSA